MKTIGLVGGVASGKSLVAKMLGERGAGLLDADRAGHSVLAEDAIVQQALRQRWGDDVLKADGTVNRKAVARHVFGTDQLAEDNRAFLESLTHPRIGDRLKAEVARYTAEGRKVVVLDAALLFEAGWEKLCDLVVFVDSSREHRLRRAHARGWSDAEFARREGAQWPIADKRRESDVVLKNDGSETELRQQVANFWDQYIEPFASAS